MEGLDHKKQVSLLLNIKYIKTRHKKQLSSPHDRYILHCQHVLPENFFVDKTNINIY